MSHRTAAQVLCDATHSIVIPVMRRLASEQTHKPMPPVSARVGSGKATYHKLVRSRGPARHEITFGQKMTESKRIRSSAERWLTGRELAQKKYYSGRFTYTRLLAHTVLHECAHALQVHLDGRQYGSVHNEDFYTALGQLHAACGDEVLSYVEDRFRALGISAEFLPEPMRTAPAAKPTIAYRVGQEVIANIRGANNRCKIRRVNKKTLTILVVEGPQKGEEWRIGTGTVVNAARSGEPKGLNFEPMVGDIVVLNTRGMRHICRLVRKGGNRSKIEFLSGPMAHRVANVSCDRLLRPTEDELTFARAIAAKAA